MTKRICPSCGRRTLLPCPSCLEHERDPGASPFDAEPAVRPHSSGKPYRLTPEHDVAIGCLPIPERAQRRAAIQHFQDCWTCQQYDRFYWALDPHDPRFQDWCHLLWTNGGLVQPDAIYEVVRFKRIPPSFGTWKASFHGTEIEALRCYLVEREEIPRTTSYETGAVLWENPWAIERIEHALSGFKAPEA